MNKKMLRINKLICFFIANFIFFIDNSIRAIDANSGNTYVVVGSSAASISAVKGLARCASQEDQIIIISKEAEFYDKRRLKRYMQKGRSPVFLLPKSDKASIKFMHNTVKHIDRYDKKVMCSDGAIVSYDYLFLGIGAQPIVPTIEGMNNCEGIFGYNTLSDVHAINNYIASHNIKNIAVLGGGLASLELTEVLTKKGYVIHHCVRSSRILREKADVGGATYIQNLFSQNGVQWHFNTQVTYVKSSNNVITNIVLNNKDELAVDMIIYAIGTKVATDLIDGLKTEQGALSVNEYMQTSDPYIYAGGDVVSVWDYVNQCFVRNGKWTSAKDQGRCAAKNMCGNKIAYSGVAPINLSKYFKMRVVLSGPMGNPPTDYIYTNDSGGWFSRMMSALFGTKNEYRAFLKKDGKLKGFCLINVPLKEIKDYSQALMK